jgi:thiol-disulfide isomerase/thioredoxin
MTESPNLAPHAYPISSNLKRNRVLPRFLAFTLPTISFIFQRLFGSFAAPSPAAMSAAKTKAQTLINENGVVVFSKSYCPYCTATKKLLNELGANFTALELDQIGK